MTTLHLLPRPIHGDYCGIIMVYRNMTRRNCITVVVPSNNISLNFSVDTKRVINATIQTKLHDTGLSLQILNVSYSVASPSTHITLSPPLLSRFLPPAHPPIPLSFILTVFLEHHQPPHGPPHGQVTLFLAPPFTKQHIAKSIRWAIASALHTPGTPCATTTVFSSQLPNPLVIGHGSTTH